MSKSVYITGIAGFIGSTLAKRLVSEGYEVSGIDNLSGSDGSNLDGVEVCWEVGDFADAPPVDADTIVHLAARTNARDYSPDIREENYNKTTSLVSKNSSKRFIFASTVLVEYPTINEYANSKYLAESYIRTFSGDYVILRFANVYGPNQRDWGTEPNVLAAWKKAVAEGEPIRIDGTGEQVRDFIHVEDIAEAIQLAIEKTEVTQRTIPICSGKQYSIRELASIVYPEPNRKYANRHPLDYDYIYQSPKIQHLELGFVPKRTIEEYGAELHGEA